ncbi:probable Glutaredoxin at C-terminar half [Coccomyxa sp. Obi]|nr:probable Glutaredoxin at C-terminar half [Coccomyxa sp. Obi]
MASVGTCVRQLPLSGPQSFPTHSRPFSNIRSNSRSRRLAVRADAGNSGGAFPENLINQLSVAVTNFSPANAVKKAIAAAQAGQYDEAAIGGKVDAYIKDNPVVVFSWTRCPFCIKAKRELDSLNAKYLAVELDTMADGNAIRSELAKRTNRTSMPNVWINGEGIGGCNDGPGLMTLQRNGELVPMLKRAGAL